MMTRSLSGRVALLVGVAIVLVLGAASLGMDHLVDAEMQHRFDAGLRTQASILESLVDIGPGGVILEKPVQPRLRLQRGSIPPTWALQCEDGERLLSDPAPAGYPAGWSQATDHSPAYADFFINGHAFRAVWFRFGAGDDAGTSTPSPASDIDTCNVVFIHSRAEQDEILSTIDDILLVIPMLALLLVLLASPWLVRRGLEPLAVLGDSMRDIGPQASGNRLPATGTKELEPLVARFNEVLARMDEGMAREREFAGALAHETRTRLAELRAMVEVEQRYPGGRSVDELLRDIGRIGADLEGTVSGLLLLTRLDAGIEGVQMTRVDMQAVIEKHVNHLTSTMHKRQLAAQWESGTPADHLHADVSLLDIIIGNVLGNACAYAPETSTIHLLLESGRLSIGNLAPELSSDEVARFGQRFWSKHHGSEGHAGLGLALAGAAARAMGMTLEFHLDDAQWLRVCLRWE
ncbi:MAG TPA: ATP-binding protein [Rhodanobacteraceae bacterium]|nr:ATP-binding protein [Rhodanobacteraceae bacterium]